MHKKLLSLLISNLILLVGFTGCGESEPGVKSTGSISGSIVDKTTGDGIPFANVKLYPSGNSMITGSDGLFSFNNLIHGDYTLVISKENYISAEENVTLSNEKTNVNILLERKGSKLKVEPDVLDFGESITSLSFTITNSGYSDIEYSVQHGQCSWLSKIQPTNGTIAFEKTATIVVEINREFLGNGENEAMIIVQSTNGAGNAEVKLKAIGEIRTTSKVNTLEATNITESKATLIGSIINEGSPTYTERGFVWSTNQNPAIDSGANSLSVAITNDKRYELSVTSLSPNTTYHAKAYVKQNGKYLYGNTVSFTTETRSAKLITLTPTQVSHNSAILNGQIIDDGSPAYTERGFCYTNDSNSTPDISSNKVIANGYGIGNYSANISDIKGLIKVRAYVIQNGKAIYGDEVQFTTVSRSAKVTTLAPTQVSYNSATLNGQIIDEGSPAYSERGFCYTYGNYSTPDITSNRVVADGAGVGDYSAPISGFNGLLTVRAYVIQDGNVIYGDEVQTKANTVKAAVATYEATNVSTNSMRLVGYVSEVGSPSYTRRGFCYCKNYDSPSINNATVVEERSSLAGQFHKDITGLESGEAYYYCAFIEQDGKIIYGNIRNTTTHASPEVGTKYKNLKADSWGITWQVTLVGWVGYEGSPAYTERGFVYGTSPDPTVGTTTKVACSGKDLEMYETDVKNLNSNKTYYARAYAKNADGYTYGNTITFSTY